ncbi:MAG: phosphoribosylformylglycinamidine cyclo-ligase [Bdellovibrionales bacterium]
MSGKSTKSYKDSGVDIEAGDRLVEWLQSTSEKKHPWLVDGIGGYASLARLPFQQYAKPLLVSCTDGVGTKALLTAQTGRVRGLGQDLVAMNVNDLICTGGDPYLFLDYWATGKLDLPLLQEFLSGVRKACEESGCLLVGGETAEMPGLYQGRDFDCAGFAIGLVDEDQVWGAHRVKPGSVLWAFESSGFHSNGYSLLRQLFAQDLDRWINFLLEPTALYVRLARELKKAKIPIQAAAHITGSGFENLLRVLPPQCQARVTAYKFPALFQEAQTRSGLSTDEMLRTFNCGVGFVVFVDPSEVARVQAVAQALQIHNWRLGVVESSPHPEPSYLWEST